METLTIYKGITKNLWQLDHNYMSDGYYGRGNYFAFEYFFAHQYGKGHDNDIIVEYQLSYNTDEYFTITDNDIKNLSAFHKGSRLFLSPHLQEKFKRKDIASTELCSILQSLGYKVIFLKRAKLQPEGGEQIIVLDNSLIRPVTATISFADNEIDTKYLTMVLDFYQQEKLEYEFFNYHCYKKSQLTAIRIPVSEFENFANLLWFHCYSVIPIIRSLEFVGNIKIDYLKRIVFYKYLKKIITPNLLLLEAKDEISLLQHLKFEFYDMTQLTVEHYQLYDQLKIKNKILVSYKVDQSELEAILSASFFKDNFKNFYLIENSQETGHMTMTNLKTKDVYVE